MEQGQLPNPQPLKLEYLAVPTPQLPIASIAWCIGGWLIVSLGITCALTGGVLILWMDKRAGSIMLIICPTLVLFGLRLADRGMVRWRNAAPRSVFRAQSLLIYFLASMMILFGVFVIGVGIEFERGEHDLDFGHVWLFILVGVPWITMGILSMRSAVRKWRRARQSW